MKAITKHALASIEEEFLDPQFLQNFEKKFVVIVPAFWSDKTKERLVIVGFGPFLLFFFLLLSPSFRFFAAPSFCRKVGTPGEATKVYNATGSEEGWNQSS
jgi:hypothetical protein